MTGQEVRGLIGSPSKTYNVDPEPAVAVQTVEVWLYMYGSELTGEQVAAGVLLLAIAFAITAAAVKGGGGGSLGGFSGGGGGEDATGYRFYVGFGHDGRVREVTLVEPCR